ncbi:MAG: DNA primase [Betaproteobacteria bacterium]|nr:DNA primase [Betaproteobacteria bacterium]
MIPQSFIQDLLGRVDIVDVVDRHVKLKRAGANYVACCPFHAEKTPSFTVSQAKQFYHCFGCGAHGTAIGFLIEYSGMGFVEAVKDLAQGAGMTVPEVRSEQTVRRAEQGESLYEVLLRATQYYRAQLKDAPRAIAYLKQRGLSGEIAKRFGVGYAPEGWQNLAAVFSDYEGKALVEAGLVIQTDEGKRYDRFRNRIMFPIVNDRGNIVGFGGRVVGEGEPKYLNSPETKIFEKGRELYGLYQARKAIREEKKVLVVEGYMDVIGLAQNDMGFAVATLGTSATGNHIQKLLRISDDVVFFFDGDEAGRRAAWRALENSLSQLMDGKQISFLFLPEGEDPDTFVRKTKKGEVWTATLFSDFLLGELKARVDLKTPEGRAKLLQDAKPLVKQIFSPFYSLMLRKELAKLTNVTHEELDREYQIKPQPASSPSLRVPAQGYPRTPPTPLARTLLRILVSNPALAEKLSEGQRVLLNSPDLAPVAELVSVLKDSGATLPAMVIEATRESQYSALYQDVAGEILATSGDEESAQADLAGAFNQLELLQIRSERERLAAGDLRNEAERSRVQELDRRLAELKGAPRAETRPRV